MQLPLRFDFLFKFTSLFIRQQNLLKTLHGFTDSVILARREKLTSKVETEEGADEKPALIDILLRATVDGQPLSNVDIREEVDTFMFAGHDTTTSAIAFCLFNIAKYPEVQQKAFEEIRNVIGDDQEKEMSLKGLNALQYLDLVIKETLRFYPSVPFLGRKIKENTIISNSLNRFLHVF